MLLQAQNHENNQEALSKFSIKIARGPIKRKNSLLKDVTSIADQILDRIKNCKSDFADAVHLLNIETYHTQHIANPISFTDFAILMALYYLKLHFIQRIISGQRRFNKKVENHIKTDQWQHFERDTYESFNPKISKILETLNEFDIK